MIFQVYAPDLGYDDITVEDFYDTLQQEIFLIHEKSKITLLWDFKAKQTCCELIPEVVEQ